METKPPLSKRGEFTIKDLAAGSYTVMAFKSEGQVMMFNKKPKAQSMAVVELKANERHDGVKLVLEKRSETIEGVVLASDGSPAVAAQVGAIDNNSAKFSGCDMAYGSKVLSDQAGHFKIDGLSKGVYGVCARQAGHPNAKVTDVSTGTKNVQLKLSAPAQITGVVVDGAGKPVSPCTVAATFRQPEEANAPFSPWKGSPSTTEVSDPSGSFTISGLAAGIWDLLATTPELNHGMARHIQLASGAKATVRLQIEQGIEVTGRLINAETKAPLAAVQVHSHMSPIPASTDADGRFRIRNVQSGMKVYVRFAPPTKDVLPDALEAWIPEKSTSFDVGTFALAPVPSADENWGQQAAAAAAGLRIRNEGGHPVVTGIYEKSPAAQSGVRVRDRVLTINGKSVENLGSNAITNLLTGETGKEVVVRVQTEDGTPRDVTIGLAKY